MQIQCGLYGLPQSGILANKLLHGRLKLHGYYELPHTPGLWKHVTIPVLFTLVVDGFGAKYTGKENIQHLINKLKETYEISEDWDGALYFVISLHRNYALGYMDKDMPHYVKQRIKQYGQKIPTKPQHTPLQPAPRKYRAAAQEPEPPDTSSPLDAKDKKIVERVLGSF